MKYFSTKLDRGFIALFSAQTIRKTGLALLTVFLPIFLFKIFGENIYFVLLFYAVGAFFYALLLPLWAQVLNRFGMKRSIIIGSLFGAAFYALLAVTNGENAFYLIPTALLVLTVFRLLFWLPYHVDFAKFTNSEDRGKGVSLMFAMVSFVGILGPILAGYILNKTGFAVLFSIVIALYLLSIVPLFRIPAVNEKYSWGYIDTLRRLFSREYRHPFIAIAARGAENVIALTIWPIFIFILLGGDVLDVGAVSTLIFGSVVILQLALGRFIDASKKRRFETLHVGSSLYALGWVVKMFVATASQIFLAGFYHGITKIFTRTPFDTMVYELAADQGHFVDEFTVLKEIAIQLGKVTGAGVVAVLVLFLSLKWAFIAAATASLLLNILYYKKEDIHHLIKDRESIPRYQLHH